MTHEMASQAANPAATPAPQLPPRWQDDYYDLLAAGVIAPQDQWDDINPACPGHLSLDNCPHCNGALTQASTTP